MVDIEKIAMCPRCLAPVEGVSHQAPKCSNTECEYAIKGFLTVAGQPVLIDFEQSIFSPSAFTDGRGSVFERDFDGSDRRGLRSFIRGKNGVAPLKASELLKKLAVIGHRPRVLVIGGGVLGAGTDALYHSEAIDLIGLDVYASPHTTLVADGHHLPFLSETFDAVWIQAVLEHVLEPQVVVSELHRVLKPRGLVYAETPFMQQVHEGAYDFTRFTLSGHRWLFRNFDQIDAGSVAGAGTAAVWSVRYLVGALGLARTRLAFPFFWLHWLDRAASPRPNADAASCVFFFGSKSDKTLTAKDMVAYYESQESFLKRQPRDGI